MIETELSCTACVQMTFVREPFKTLYLNLVMVNSHCNGNHNLTQTQWLYLVENDLSLRRITSGICDNHRKSHIIMFKVHIFTQLCL